MKTRLAHLCSCSCRAAYPMKLSSQAMSLIFAGYCYVLTLDLMQVLHEFVAAKAKDTRRSMFDSITPT